MRARACLVAAAAALAATVHVAAAAKGGPIVHRLVRFHGWESGSPWSYASSVEQDRRGFLWITTTSGLFRFDGTRALRVGPSLHLAPGSTAVGRVVAFGAGGAVFEATADGLVRLDDGPTAGEAAYTSVAVASDGTLWRVRDGVVERLGPDRAWVRPPFPPSPNDPPRGVAPGRSGRVYVVSRSRVWTVEGGGSVRLLAPIERAMTVLERADGTVVVGTNQDPGPVTTRLFEVASGVVRTVYEETGARFISMAERGDAIWIAMDAGLQALGPGFVARDRLTAPTIPATGHVLVDREGSVWMATPRGLVQIPEPDAYAVLPPSGGVTRDLARSAGGVWGTFWGVLGFLPDGRGAPGMIEADQPFYATLCGDGAGRVWTGGSSRPLPRGDGALRPITIEGWNPLTCGQGTGGRRWIVTAGGRLWTVAPEDRSPRPVPVPVEVDRGDGIELAAEDGEGRLWLTSGPRVCAASAAGVLAGTPVAWRCEEIPGIRWIADLQSMPSGDLWALPGLSGKIYRRAGGRWEVVPGSESLGMGWLITMVPSPAGGVWIAGQGVLLRVAERCDDPEGWEVRERPTAWNGLVTLNVVALEEDADGTLWLGTDLGIQRISPEVRRRRADPPAVELVVGSVNGEPIDRADSVELPHGRNRLETHFAALTYRDPAAVRYRMRLRADDPWSPPAADGRFTFVDLAPGRYVLEVAASLDGDRWSATPARLSFRVKLPWYARAWFLGGATLAVGVAGHLGSRLRARRRLAVEKQRTRIAMDLHDEVGSGLGTIAVLAGIAGRPDLPPERRDDVAARIAAVSQELARSLGDIVWSLRTSSGTLESLWHQLVERARPLFPSDVPRATFEAPDPVPDEALSLVVRRNLHLVAYEALHNAARHSGATAVVLRLARDGAGWRFEVEDDGRGLPAGPPVPSVRRGLGIEAMRARVAEMRGTIAWDRGTLGGTRVTVRFRTGDR